MCSSLLCSLAIVLGIDSSLAQHIAHLFVRDAVILFEEKLHLDDRKDTDHFEVTLGGFFPLSHCIFLLIEYQFY